MLLFIILYTLHVQEEISYCHKIYTFEIFRYFQDILEQKTMDFKLNFQHQISIHTLMMYIHKQSIFQFKNI